MNKLGIFKAILEESQRQQNEDRTAGRVRFGGRFDFFRASTERSYREAATVIVEHALGQPTPEDWVQPAVYLLRHALELELKSLIWSAWDIEDMQASANARKEIITKRNDNQMKTHDLQRLHDLLVKALLPIELTVPLTLTSLVSELHAFDDGDPTRTRYSRGVQSPYTEESYPKEVTADLRKWLDQLTAYHASDGAVRDEFWKFDDQTFSEQLYERSEGLTQHLLDSGIMTLQKLPPDDE